MPISDTAVRKAEFMLAKCSPDLDVSHEKLVDFATFEGGCVNDEVRRYVWPKLLGYDPRNIPLAYADNAWDSLPPHRDEDQVRLDVHRSFVYYPKDQSGEQLDRRKRELSSIITATLRTYPKLCYFQGFHDIVQVFLLVLGPTQAIAAVAHLSLLRIRDFMLPSLSPSLAHLRLLPPILKSVDVRLYQHLSQTQPFFALAATLTLYAHEIQEYGDIARLFDFFLAREAAISVYFFAVIVMSRRDELFEIPADEPEMLHSVLSKMPRPLDLENLISRTMEIFTQHPPSSLSWWNWLQISQYSVLKTTRTPMQTQSLEQGAQLFKMQAVQLRRQERRKQALAWAWKHRRPAARTSLGLLIVGFSLYLQRKGLGSPIASNPWRVRETWRCWLR